MRQTSVPSPLRNLLETSISLSPLLLPRPPLFDRNENVRPDYNRIFETGPP